MKINKYYNNLKYPILIFFSLTISYGLSYVTKIPFLSLILIATLIIVELARIIKIASFKNNAIIIILIVLIRSLLLLYQTLNKDIPLGGVDWIHYDQFGRELLSFSNGNILSILTLGDYNLFIRITALFYMLFGISTEQMFFWVFLTSLITARYIYLTSKIILKNNKHAQIVMILFLIWPIEIIHSITFLREMPIQMFVIISFYYFVLFLKEHSYFKLFLSLISITIATLLHSGMIGILITYLFILTFSNKKSFSYPNLLKLALFLVVIFFIIRIPAFTSKFGQLSDFTDLIDNLTNISTVYGSNATTNYVNSSPNNLKELIFQLPYLLFMFTLSPLPWQIVNLGTLVAFLVEGVLRLLMVLMIARYIFIFRSKNDFDYKIKILFVFLILLTYIIFSLGTKSYGTAIRHRTKIFPIEIIFSYLGYLTLIFKRKDAVTKVKI